MTAPSNAVLVDRARRVAESHPPRTPERRVAVAAWVALRETSTVDAACRALGTFADPATADSAAILVRQLAEQDTTTERRAL